MVKLKKKLFITSDGRIYFKLSIPFKDSFSVLISCFDSFLIYTSKNLKKNLITLY